MKGVVLGNGPSKHLYDRTGDFVIGCNIPGEGYSVDATVIVDPEIVWILANDLELIDCPVILSNIAWEKMKQLKMDGYFNILYTFKSKDWYNAGHYAALYLIHELKCDKIDIWGCDSIFDDTLKSSTDTLVPKVESINFYKRWRLIWFNLMEAHPSIDFNIKK